MLGTEADLKRFLKIKMQKKTRRFPVTSEKKMISNIVNYTNVLLAETCTSEEDVLNIYSNAPVVVHFGSVSSPLCVWELERVCSQK